VPAARAVEALERTLVATRTTVVRAAAGDAAARIGQLAFDATIRATGRTQIGAQAWYRVAFQNREGWVSSTTLREIDPAEAAVWPRVRDGRDAAALEEFLREYPRGHYAARARQALEALRAPAPTNVPPAAVARPPAAVTPPAANAGAISGCYRTARSGGNYVRFCFEGGGGAREESVSSQSFGYTQANMSQSTLRDVCRAPLSIASGGDELRVSWPAATCGTGSSSGGSALCRVGGDRNTVVCGGETYRRD
jgi:hypothetical protein